MVERRRVLLVLPDTASLAACRAALRAGSVPFDCECLLSGAATLARLERLVQEEARPPLFDVVAYDVVVDDVAPRELIGHLAAIMPGVPIVAVVPTHGASAAADALRAGASEVVVRTPDVAEHLPLVLKLCADRFGLARELDAQRLRLTELATRDELTDMSNRRRFNEALDHELERAERYHRPLSLVLVDLDALKAINDSRGHQAGDAALRHVAWVLRAETRRYEVAARFGGDEFATILIDTNYDVGRVVGEKYRSRVASRSAPGVGQVTVSAGVASFPAHGANAVELVRAADEALYEAKRLGRNRVVVSRAFRQQRVDDRHPVHMRVVLSGRNSAGQPFTEETETELISSRGARVVTSQTLATGEHIELTTPFHEKPLTAQITACYLGADERWHVGFKLVEPAQWSKG